MKQKRTGKAKGFTLLEVLVSAVLLASVFVAVMSLSSQSLRNLSRFDEQQLAIAHAREKMNQVLLLEELKPGISSGAWSDGCRWEVRIAGRPGDAKSAAPEFDLFEIRVVIAWGEFPAGKSYAIETTQWARRQVPNAGS